MPPGGGGGCMLRAQARTYGHAPYVRTALSIRYLSSQACAFQPRSVMWPLMSAWKPTVGVQAGCGVLPRVCLSAKQPIAFVVPHGTRHAPCMAPCMAACGVCLAVPATAAVSVRLHACVCLCSSPQQATSTSLRRAGPPWALLQRWHRSPACVAPRSAPRRSAARASAHPEHRCRPAATGV